MFDDCFSRVFDACSRKQRLIVVLASCITASAALGLEWISLENDLESMLPGDDYVRRSMRFLQESNFSDDVVISLRLTSADRSPDHLVQAAIQLEEAVGPPLVTGVVSGVSGVAMVDEVIALLKHLPELTDERALSRIEGQLTPEGVNEGLRRSYRQLVTPVSTFATPIVRSDPLGLSSAILGALQGLSSSLRYEVEIEDGHFISRDHAHTMLVVQTPIKVTDASGARDLVNYLREKLSALPEFISADIIAGHLHTVSNEDVIKRDIWWALGIAGAAFFFLFVFLFGDARALLLFFLPVASVLIAINLSNLLLSHLSYFIVGMGGVVAGISVDYGIHVYMAVRAGKGRAGAVKQVAKPVVTGALTTVAVFGAFFFSSVQGYHQLAVFSIASILLCLTCALLLLPHLLAGRRRAAWGKPFRGDRERRFQKRGGLIVACWGLMMIAALVSMRGLDFDDDISRFDGSEPAILEAERRFHGVWGGQERPALFVVPGDGLEEALRLNRTIYREAVAVMTASQLASLSEIWPPREERIANRARWREFWNESREAELVRLLREGGAAYGFSDDAFSPFFENLRAEPLPGEELEDLEIFARVKERFVQERESGYQVLSFFPDEERFVSRMSEIGERHPGTFVVSRSALSSALSRSVSSEIVFLSGVAGLLVPVMAGLLLRDIRLTVLALVPVVTGVMAVLGLVPVLGLSLNAPSVISAMVVVGLCIDYGIFMVYDCHYRMETGTRTAVNFCAVTTLIGAGVLLFARHPILFSIGLTMVTGVLAGYVSSILVVPSLYRWLVREGTTTG